MLNTQHGAMVKTPVHLITESMLSPHHFIIYFQLYYYFKVDY
jgi:hypothetical protein